MRGGQCFSQRTGQQMEIYGNQQTAKKDAPGKISGQKHEPQNTGCQKQDPVRTGDKCQYALLNFQPKLISFRVQFPEACNGKIGVIIISLSL